MPIRSGNPNFEHCTFVQKKKPTRKNGYDSSLVSKVRFSGLDMSY